MEDHPRECGIVQMALDAGCDCPESVLGLANWILQADDIPVYAYGLDHDVFSATSPEEKMGYSWAVESGLYGMLDNLGVAGFFDFEAYGERMGEDCFLGEDGYIDGSLDMPDEEKSFRFAGSSIDGDHISMGKGGTGRFTYFFNAPVTKKIVVEVELYLEGEDGGSYLVRTCYDVPLPQPTKSK